MPIIFFSHYCSLSQTESLITPAAPPCPKSTTCRLTHKCSSTDSDTEVSDCVVDSRGLKEEKEEKFLRLWCKSTANSLRFEQTRLEGKVSSEENQFVWDKWLYLHPNVALKPTETETQPGPVVRNSSSTREVTIVTLFITGSCSVSDAGCFHCRGTGMAARSETCKDARSYHSFFFVAPWWSGMHSELW